MKPVVAALLLTVFGFSSCIHAASVDVTKKAIRSKDGAKAKGKVRKPSSGQKASANYKPPSAEVDTSGRFLSMDTKLHLPGSEAALEREILAARSIARQEPTNRDAVQRLAQAAVGLTDRLLAAQAVGNTAKADRIAAYLAANLSDVGPGVQDLARKGDPKAQQSVAYLHYRGVALPADPIKACDAFKRVSDSLPSSAWHTAQCQMEKSPDEAWIAMERAALLGHAGAQEWMGRRCLGEFGAVGKDFECARGWLAQSATLGRPRSQTLLGYLLNAGLGGPADSSRALRLYTLAAENGDPDAQNNLGEIYEAGRGVERSLASALQWYERAAGKGLPAAQFNAGRLLAVGVEDKAEPARARALLVQAELKGVIQARQVLEWLDRQEADGKARESRHQLSGADRR